VLTDLFLITVINEDLYLIYLVTETFFSHFIDK
jgi:hypothetical protein